jgi:hypothetical protein
MDNKQFMKQIGVRDTNVVLKKSLFGSASITSGSNSTSLNKEKRL